MTINAIFLQRQAWDNMLKGKHSKKTLNRFLRCVICGAPHHDAWCRALDYGAAVSGIVADRPVSALCSLLLPRSSPCVRCAKKTRLSV